MWLWTNHFLFCLCLENGVSRMFLHHRHAVSMADTWMLWLGGCRSVESRQMCYCPSAAALAESCSGFPQDWVKRMFFLPPLYFHSSFYFFFSAIEYTIWLFTGVDLESGCSLKDEGMWGCKTTRFALIWILTKVDTLHILPHLTPIVSCGSPSIEIYWWETLI